MKNLNISRFQINLGLVCFACVCLLLLFISLLRPYQFTMRIWVPPLGTYTSFNEQRDSLKEIARSTEAPAMYREVRFTDAFKGIMRRSQGNQIGATLYGVSYFVTDSKTGKSFWSVWTPPQMEADMDWLYDPVIITDVDFAAHTVDCEAPVNQTLLAGLYVSVFFLSLASGTAFMIGIIDAYHARDRAIVSIPA